MTFVAVGEVRVLSESDVYPVDLLNANSLGARKSTVPETLAKEHHADLQF